MPHHGEYEHVKEWLMDHDTDVVDEEPPVQDTWYTIFHAEDVRLLLCFIRQDNDETDAKNIEVRWTIDGNVYFDAVSAANGTVYYVRRTYDPSGGGTAGLLLAAGASVAVLSVDKRGLDFKVEVRITSVVGTNQRLRGWCVRETLEVT